MTKSYEGGFKLRTHCHWSGFLQRQGALANIKREWVIDFKAAALEELIQNGIQKLSNSQKSSRLIKPQPCSRLRT